MESSGSRRLDVDRKEVVANLLRDPTKALHRIIWCRSRKSHEFRMKGEVKVALLDLFQEGGKDTLVRFIRCESVVLARRTHEFRIESSESTKSVDASLVVIICLFSLIISLDNLVPTRDRFVPQDSLSSFFCPVLQGEVCLWFSV